MNCGKFIVLEGIDGSGKTTQCRLLCDYLTGVGIKSVQSSEPTGGECGRLLRELLGGKAKISETAMAALFTADRLDHIENIKKLLAAGTSVVCDRYYFSSYAYNAHSLPVEDIINLNAICAKQLKPDICIYIDISPAEAMARITANRSEQNREIYETEEYLKTVSSRYKRSFELSCNTENVIIIDGERLPEEVFEDVKRAASLVL